MFRLFVTSSAERAVAKTTTMANYHTGVDGRVPQNNTETADRQRRKVTKPADRQRTKPVVALLRSTQQKDPILL